MSYITTAGSTISITLTSPYSSIDQPTEFDASQCQYLVKIESLDILYLSVQNESGSYDYFMAGSQAGNADTSPILGISAVDATTTDTTDQLLAALEGVTGLTGGFARAGGSVVLASADTLSGDQLAGLKSSLSSMMGMDAGSINVTTV